MIENKPGIYNAPSVYNAKCIYNGETVYNEGGITPPVTMTVNIGGIDYPYVEINGLYWITENIRNETEHYFNPPNVTPANGKLYKARYLEEITALLSDGWRVPAHNDFLTWENLSTNSNEFISIDLGGNDLYGLNLPLPGYRNTNASFVYAGTRCLLWSTTPKDSTHTYCASFVLNGTRNLNDYGVGTTILEYNSAFSVRVCKDV